MKMVIYPVTRAIEHACTQPGIVPVRVFPVLWPLWQVDARVETVEPQEFSVIEHFAVRAIEEGGIGERGELVTFLGLPASLVDLCLASLRETGHVSSSGPRLELTDLGKASLHAGTRLVQTTRRQRILIDRQTGWPLPRAHDDAGVAVLERPEVQEGQISRSTTFLRLFTRAGFEPKVLSWLESHPEKASFGLPERMRGLHQDGVREGFLPSYLIETGGGDLLAYSAAGEHRDEFLERVCAATPVRHLIDAEPRREPEAMWREWLARSEAYREGTLEQQAGGLWRVVLPAGAFGEAPKARLVRLGSYQVHHHYFVQVWCDDQATREAGLRRRLLSIATQPGVTGEAELMRRMRILAGTLQVQPIEMKELRDYALRTGEDRWSGRLDALADLH